MYLHTDGDLQSALTKDHAAAFCAVGARVWIRLAHVGVGAVYGVGQLYYYIVVVVAQA